MNGDVELDPAQFPTALAAQSGTPKESKELTNEDIVTMVRAGLAEETILAVVRSSRGRYQLDAQDLIALKEAGVSEKILQAMLAGGNK